MTFWTLTRIADALGDLVTGSAPADHREITAIATDTRSIENGSCFVALSGERFDAHDFLDGAVEKGASALVVSDARRAARLGVPVFEVRSTLAALGRLGRYRRRAWSRPVVAVAGSSGKTSTKELIRAALGARLEVHATTANLNNQVGVPLTLLALPEGKDIAVVEIGTNMPGEIELLRAIVEPDITVITSIGEEHLEGLGDIDGVMREELAAVDGVPVAITPASQPEIAERARGRAKRVVTAGLDDGDLRAGKWGIDPDGRGWIEVDGATIRPPVLGAHNLRNAMLAIAVARECGVTSEDAAKGIAAMPVPSMRMATQQLGRAMVINDAYNANPPSTRAALELLELAGRDRAGQRQRVAVLGTMLELGAHGERLHREIAELAIGSSINVVAGVGEMGKALRQVANGDDRVLVADELDTLWSQLEPRLMH
jgi:UDP-N-acetylmuramoyl-tripeptide--D-alanyl-D-alanine ligase